MASTKSLFLILFGILLAAVIGPATDGFLQGLAEGLGIGLILLGVYALGREWRQRRDGDDTDWLPSRDGER